MKNKTLIIVLITIFSIFALSLTGFLIVALRNGTNFNFAIGFSSKESDNLVLDKTYSNNFNDINVQSNAANVYVKGTNSSDIKVLIYSKSSENEKIETVNNSLNITSKVKTCKGFCFNQEISRIEIYIPTFYYGILNINSNYGDIKIGDFPNIELNIDTDAGDIEIGNAKEVKLDSSYCDIKVGTVEESDIKLSAGDLKIDRVNKIKVENNYGDINIKRINEFLDIKSNYGDVSLDDINLVTNSYIELDY